MWCIQCNPFRRLHPPARPRARRSARRKRCSLSDFAAALGQHVATHLRVGHCAKRAYFSVMPSILRFSTFMRPRVCVPACACTSASPFVRAAASLCVRVARVGARLDLQRGAEYLEARRLLARAGSARRERAEHERHGLRRNEAAAIRQRQPLRSWHWTARNGTMLCQSLKPLRAKPLRADVPSRAT